MLDAGNFAFLFARRESCLAVWSATQVVSSRHASRGAHPLGAGQALEGMPCLTVSDRSWAFEQQGLSISWGFQTEVFNILGPLTNPAKPDGMVCGVFTASLGRLFVEVFKLLGEPLRNFVETLSRLGCGGMKRALVVHGCEGLDELSIAGPSQAMLSLHLSD